MARLGANGIDIEYDVRGSGEPILFIMGLGGQLIDWRTEFVDLFVEAGYQAIRFDNRDSGLSSQTDAEPPSRVKIAAHMATRRRLSWDGYDLADMAADAAGLLDALGIESAHIVGASMGAMIAQELTINHPTRVRSLCSIMSNTGDRKNGSVALSLLATLARRSEPDTRTAVQDFVAVSEAITGPHFDRAAQQAHAEASVARSFSPDGIARQTAAIAASRDRTALLRHLRVPTLVIHGLADRLVLPSGGRVTAQAVPNSRLLCFPDMGHDVPEPRWAEIRDAIVVNMNRDVSVAS